MEDDSWSWFFCLQQKIDDGEIPVCYKYFAYLLTANMSPTSTVQVGRIESTTTRIIYWYGS